MVRPEIPYPPTPADVPAELTRPTGRYKNQVVVVLVSLLVFFLLYLTLLAASGVIFTLAAVRPIPFLLRVPALIFSALLFLFLVKGFFKRDESERSLRVELAEDDHPTLFAFIDRVCDETGAGRPARIYASADVNAAVFRRTSVLGLVWPGRKNLLIGLGLVNCLNLSEFKAAMAHEFGHFRQRSMGLDSYTYTAMRIIRDLVVGRDWLDALMERCRGHGNAAVKAVGFGYAAMTWPLRKLLEGMYGAIVVYSAALSRQMEFNADRVAVRVAGSDAIVNGLARLRFASEAFDRTMQDLKTAADHRLFSCDLFHHLHPTADYLRKLRNDPDLGLPPPVPDDPELTAEVFQPGDTERPPMWASHPSNYDREQNAKAYYVRGVVDERSPWLLFDDAATLRERLTWLVYRRAFGVSRRAEVCEAEDVQKFIDEERAETTYDPRYCGVYDGRLIKPGDPDELNALVAREVWPADRIRAVHAGLYDDELKARAEVYKERLGEQGLLREVLRSGDEVKWFEFRGRRREPGQAERLLEKVEKELEEDYRDLAALDRRVYLVHLQMARPLGPAWERDLVRRYRFHLALQEIGRDLMYHQPRCLGLTREFFRYRPGQWPRGLAEAVFEAFREAHADVRRDLKRARDLPLPALSNLDEGTPLDEFLLERRLVPGLRNRISSSWMFKFLDQLAELCDRHHRIHFKSLGSLLRLQDQVARRWQELQAMPVPVLEEARPRKQSRI